MDKYRIYKDEKIIAEGESPLAITGLAPATVVLVGTYQATRFNEQCESEKVDIPGFKTKEIAVTGVELLPKEVATKIGENTQHLQVKFIPDDASNKNFTLISKDEKIATVNPYTGQITGIAVGETEGQVTTEDGQFVASAKITVVEASNQEESVIQAEKETNGENKVKYSTKMTANEMRTVLDRKGIDYKSSATKAELLNLLEENVKRGSI